MLSLAVLEGLEVVAIFASIIGTWFAVIGWKLLAVPEPDQSQPSRTLQSGD